MQKFIYVISDLETLADLEVYDTEVECVCAYIAKYAECENVDCCRYITDPRYGYRKFDWDWYLFGPLCEYKGGLK